jgi:hypothetical protein
MLDSPNALLSRFYSLNSVVKRVVSRAVDRVEKRALLGWWRLGLGGLGWGEGLVGGVSFLLSIGGGAADDQRHQ